MLPNMPRRLRSFWIMSRIFGDGDAAEHVAEAGEVLGRGVEADVGAELQRVLEGGPEEGVVDHDHRPVGMLERGVGGALDIGHDQGRVGGRLQKHDAAVRGRADGLVDRRGCRPTARRCRARRTAPGSVWIRPVVPPYSGVV